MTYGDLKLRFYFAYADQLGLTRKTSPALYFAVIDIANEAGCANEVEPEKLMNELAHRGFSYACIAEVLAVMPDENAAISCAC